MFRVVEDYLQNKKVAAGALHRPQFSTDVSSLHFSLCDQIIHILLVSKRDGLLT